MVETRAETRELLRRSRRGEGGAFAALYDQLAPDVARFLCGLRLGLDAAALEDAVQETFLRLLDALGRIDEGRPLRPFALGVARRVALELCRRRAPTVEVPDRPDPDGGAAERLERDERRALVGQALAGLDPELRTLLALRHTSGLKMQELADGLDCSLPTARARLREAERVFAARLRQLGLLGEDAR